MNDMLINREKVKAEFAAYVKDYDINDVKIALKVKHTYKVAELCEQIANSLGLSKTDVDLAWLSGMLHDIGRFEQCRIYDTFIDSESVNHAAFGADLLFGQERLIDRFTNNHEEDVLLHDAIYYHNVYRLPDDMDDRTRMFTNILRDADKVDIIRVNNEVPLEDVYNCSREEVINSSITDEVLQNFNDHIAVDRSLKRTAIDNLVGHASMMYELVYPLSRKLVVELGYIEEMFEFKSNNSDTQFKFDKMKVELMNYLQKSIN